MLYEREGARLACRVEAFIKWNILTIKEIKGWVCCMREKAPDLLTELKHSSPLNSQNIPFDECFNSVSKSGAFSLIQHTQPLIPLIVKTFHLMNASTQ